MARKTLTEALDTLVSFSPLWKEPTPEKGEEKTIGLSRDLLADGVIDSEFAASGGMAVFSYENTAIPKDEAELIQNYRMIAQSSEVDEALQEIRNEIFIFDVPGKRAFELNFKDDGKVSDSVAERVVEEFGHLYDNVVKFDEVGIQLFDDWYIDGKLILHKVLNSKRPRDGIRRVVPLDPLKVRRVRILPPVDRTGSYDLNKVEECYIYSESYDPHRSQTYSLNHVQTLRHGEAYNGVKLPSASVTYVHSNNFDRAVGRYVGHLRKAIIPYNNLRMMEDAMIIFRVARAPVRRVIYIDVSNMQKNKAEQYMKDMMARFKNKMVFDSKTGSLADRRNLQSMLEDYWLPRRDGGKGTEVENIDGQSHQEILEEVEFFRDKLWRALNVPRSRFSEQPTSFMFGKGVEIQRDEYRFKKFLDRLRRDFLRFMVDLLKTQCILKKICTEEEWLEIERSFYWQFTEDNAFSEFKESEILNNRLATLGQIDSYVGKYFSREWVQRNVLRFTDEDISLEKKRIESEPKQEEEEEGYE